MRSPPGPLRARVVTPSSPVRDDRRSDEARSRTRRPARTVGGTRALGLALLASVGGCSRTSAEDDATAAMPPVRDALVGDSPIASFEARPVARGLEVIDAAADGRVLAGKRRAAPDRSSAKLVFDAELFDGRGEPLVAALPDGVQDARFAPPPARSVAVLGADDTLLLYEPPYQAPERIADGAFPGFSFSNDGASLAFSRGDAPELYGYRMDLVTGERTKLTHHGMPVWGFAFSPDDSRIAFVDSREGYPSLMMTDPAGGSLAKLTNRTLRPSDQLTGALAPVPDGRRPPIWATTGLWLEDQAGVHAIDADGRVRLSRPGATELHRGRAPGMVLFREGGKMRRVP